LKEVRDRGSVSGLIRRVSISGGVEDKVDHRIERVRLRRAFATFSLCLISGLGVFGPSDVDEERLPLGDRVDKIERLLPIRGVTKALGA